MTNKPPPFPKYIAVSGDDIRQKIRSGEVVPHIYSGEAKGDFEPVPLSAAEFFAAEEADRDEDGEPDPRLKPYQIMWWDRDRRRPAATRRAIPVPHWVYVMKAVPKKERSGPGAAEQYDWDHIEQLNGRPDANRIALLMHSHKTATGHSSQTRSARDLIAFALHV
jgi:hypothetical protein